jgi:apolipoprotein N-acyltransferase
MARNRKPQRPQQAASGASAAAARAEAATADRPASDEMRPEQKAPPKDAPKMSLTRALALGLLSGVALPLAFPKWDIFPIALLALAPLLWVAEDTNKGRAFLSSWLAGFLTNVIGYSFLTVTLSRFGNFPMWLSVFGAVLLSAYQGLRHALWILFVGIATRRRWPLWLAAPAVAVALELTMPFLFVYRMGDSQYLFTTYIQSADLFGVYAVSALVVLANVLVYELFKALVLKSGPLNRRVIGGLVAVQVVALGYGFYRVADIESAMAAAPAKKVGVIQPNFDIDVKGKAGMEEDQLAKQQQLTRDAEAEGAEIVFWPETTYVSKTYPRFLTHNAVRLPIGSEIHDGINVPVLFGAVTVELPKKKGDKPIFRNSAFLASPDDDLVGPYDKNFLVWFSEAVPFSEVFPFLSKWSEEIFENGDNFQRGAGAVGFAWGDFVIAPNICNDDIMPAMSLRLAETPANLMVNVTNDSWFGDTGEPYFHLALSTFRSVETHLFLVRATNTGVSAYIDALGRIYETTPVTLDSGEALHLVSEVRMMPAQKTIYQRIGNTFAYLCVALSLVALFVRRRQNAPIA